MLDLIHPEWAAPTTVKAFATTRIGGVSKGAYASLNLGVNCGNELVDVLANRRRLREQAALPSEPKWLTQVHGIQVLAAHAIPENSEPEADASWTNRAGVVCVAQSADCLPVLFADRHGRAVAAAHAGWRGLAAGVLEAVVATLQAEAGVEPEDLLAWFGPAIGPQYFQVGDDVRDEFMQSNFAASECFVADGDRWLANICGLARQRLAAVGVADITDSGLCTYSNPQQFYSYRRDHTTGRLASMIYLANASATNICN